MDRFHPYPMSRRGILKGSAAALGGALWPGEPGRATPQNVNTHSRPSDLRITDLRIVHITKAPMNCPLLRIDTNQDVYGLGEVRDGASPTYALMLKSRLIGENPARSIGSFAGSSNSGDMAGRGAA